MHLELHQHHKLLGRPQLSAIEMAGSYECSGMKSVSALKLDRPLMKVSLLVT
jgi:hypothetical protein